MNYFVHPAPPNPYASIYENIFTVTITFSKGKVNVDLSISKESLKTD
jgi:hypothetical protein